MTSVTLTLTTDRIFTDGRSVDRFTGGEVTDEHLRAAYDLVKWGPTAMNSTPLRVAAVRSVPARERLVAHMAEGNRAKTLAAPLSLVVAADRRFHEHLETLAPHRAAMRDDLEAAVERRDTMARQSALIQVGYLILGLRAVGLHVGPMGGFDSAGVDAEFFAASGWTSLLVLNVGHDVAPDGVRPRGARLGFEQVTTTL